MADTQQAGCYGKIPAFGDFVSFGKDTKIVSQWREWLHAAFTGEHYKDTVRAGWEPGADGAARWFVYYPERKGLLTVGLAGVIAPSADSTGVRPFPFSLFVEIGRMDLRSSLFRHLRGLEPAWRRLDDLRADMQGAENLNDALSRVEQRGDVPWRTDAVDAEELETMLRRTALVELADPSDDDEDDTVARIAGYLVQLRRFGQIVDMRGQAAAALRIPLSYEVSPTTQLAAWMMALNQHRRLSRLACSVFFSGEDDEDGAGDAFLFWRPLTPGDGRAVLGVSEGQGITELDGDVSESELDGVIERLGDEPTLASLARFGLWA